MAKVGAFVDLVEDPLLGAIVLRTSYILRSTYDMILYDREFGLYS